MTCGPGRCRLGPFFVVDIETRESATADVNVHNEFDSRTRKKTFDADCDAF